MSDCPPVGATPDEPVTELLPEHRDFAWRDMYGYEWQWVKWASQEWDWGMRDANCLPWQRCFYGGHSYRAPFTLIGPVGTTDSPDEDCGCFEGHCEHTPAIRRTTRRRKRRQPFVSSGPDFVGAVAEIRALHQAGVYVHYEGPPFCHECHVRYPCPTVAALDRAGCP